MKSLLALARWELRLALRSARCKAAVLAYLCLAAVPPALIGFWSRAFTYGSATFLEHLMDVQPFLTILVTVLVAGHRSDAASWPQMWTVLASSPLGNAGYLFGRWLSVVSILLPVTALPVLLAAGMAAAAGAEWHDPGAWLGSWALRVAPTVPLASAMWLGLVTILGGDLAALAVAFVGVGLAVRIANQVLLHFHLLLKVSPILGSYVSFAGWARLPEAMTGPSRVDLSQWLRASEAPFDARAVAEWIVPQLLAASGVTALALGLAVAWVQRSRRDLAPRTVRPDHPLRTYLEALLKLRERLAPTAGLGRRDRLAMACGLLLLAGGVTANIERQTRFQGLARQRFETAVADPFAPLEPEVTPRAWRIRGELRTSGEVALEVLIGDWDALEVPPELVWPRVELEVEIEAPAAFLADACGHWSRKEGNRSRIAGTCRTPLAGYTVYGGSFQALEDEGVVFAALAPHLALAAGHAESLAAAARISDRAWPGIGGFGDLVVAEWVPLFKRSVFWQRAWADYTLHDRLLLVNESSLGPGVFEGEALVAELMARDLLLRRDVEPSQKLLFRETIEALMQQRMGVSSHKDATVSVFFSADEEALKKPLLEAGPYSSIQWSLRLPAVLFALAARVGSTRLFEVFDEFLSSSSEEPGTMRELFALLEQESGTPLQRFTGEVVCPVVVKTETATIKTLVTVESESASRFEVRTPTAPYAVQLDPAGTCHRLVTRARAAAEHVDLSRTGG